MENHEEETATNRRNELAMQVDEIVSQCRVFDSTHEKFGAWMKKNWKLVEELRSLFPPQGSHRKVSVLGTLHTWDSYCTATFGNSRGHVTELLKFYRDEEAGASHEPDPKRSEAAKKANAARKAKPKAQHIEFKVQESDTDEDDEDDGDSEPEEDDEPKLHGECTECAPLKKRVAELEGKLAAARAYSAGAQPAMNDDAVLLYLKQAGGIVNGNKPQTGNVRAMMTKVVSLLKKLGITNIDAQDDFVIVNYD